MNEKKLGIEATAFFSVYLEKDNSKLDYHLKMATDNNPNIQSCYITSGDVDVFIIAKFFSLGDYKEFTYNFTDLFADIKIAKYSSQLVIKSICEGRPLPLYETPYVDWGRS